MDGGRVGRLDRDLTIALSLSLLFWGGGVSLVATHFRRLGVAFILLSPSPILIYNARTAAYGDFWGVLAFLSIGAGAASMAPLPAAVLAVPRWSPRWQRLAVWRPYRERARQRRFHRAHAEEIATWEPFYQAVTEMRALAPWCGSSEFTQLEPDFLERFSAAVERANELRARLTPYDLAVKFREHFVRYAQFLNGSLDAKMAQSREHQFWQLLDRGARRNAELRQEAGLDPVTWPPLPPSQAHREAVAYKKEHQGWIDIDFLLPHEEPFPRSALRLTAAGDGSVTTITGRIYFVLTNNREGEVSLVGARIIVWGVTRLQVFSDHYKLVDTESASHGGTLRLVALSRSNRLCLTYAAAYEGRLTDESTRGRCVLCVSLVGYGDFYREVPGWMIAGGQGAWFPPGDPRARRDPHMADKVTS